MRSVRTLVAVALVALVANACSAAGDPDDTAGPTEITLLTHDSFEVSQEVWDEFTADTGITVNLVEGTDAGGVVNQAILSADDPIADVVFGIDTTFLSRALEADILVAYESPGLDRVPDDLEADPRVTPVTVGDVCLNYDVAFFEGDLAPPASLDDLVDPAYAGLTVVMNPATSSPGLAFLLATIETYGDDGWEAWWQQLVDNGVRVTSGWSEAYYGDFTVAGGGDRPIVVSYATSPPAEVIFAPEPVTEAPTAVVTEGCFRQVEFAGILQASPAAEALIDFMLTTTFQEDVPLSMFVYPAVSEVAIPGEFSEFGARPDRPLTMDAARIEANRETWIDRWTEIVLP